MADPVTWTAIAAISSAAGTVHAVESSNQQRRLASQKADAAKQDFASAQAAQAEQDKRAAMTEEQTKARARQKSLQAGFGGRQSTILTSPLAGQAAQGKTVLGA
jgi:hypothetical protein